MADVPPRLRHRWDKDRPPRLDAIGKVANDRPLSPVYHGI
jgi:hypothetical protein